MPIIGVSETMKRIDEKEMRKKKGRKEERGDASYSERVKGES